MLNDEWMLPELENVLTSNSSTLQGDALIEASLPNDPFRKPWLPRPLIVWSGRRSQSDNVSRYVESNGYIQRYEWEGAGWPFYYPWVERVRWYNHRAFRRSIYIVLYKLEPARAEIVIATRSALLIAQRMWIDGHIKLYNPPATVPVDNIVRGKFRLTLKPHDELGDNTSPDMWGEMLGHARRLVNHGYTVNWNDLALRAFDSVKEQVSNRPDETVPILYQMIRLWTNKFDRALAPDITVDYENANGQSTVTLHPSGDHVVLLQFTEADLPDSPLPRSESPAVPSPAVPSPAVPSPAVPSPAVPSQAPVSMDIDEEVRSSSRSQRSSIRPPPPINTAGTPLQITDEESPVLEVPQLLRDEAKQREVDRRVRIHQHARAEIEKQLLEQKQQETRAQKELQDRLDAEGRERIKQFERETQHVMNAVNVEAEEQAIESSEQQQVQEDNKDIEQLLPPPETFTPFEVLQLHFDARPEDVLAQNQRLTKEYKEKIERVQSSNGRLRTSYTLFLTLVGLAGIELRKPHQLSYWRTAVARQNRYPLTQRDTLRFRFPQPIPGQTVSTDLYPPSPPITSQNILDILNSSLQWSREYHADTILGEGSFSYAIRCTNRRTRSTFVAKMARPIAFVEPWRLKEEYEVLTKLQDSPRIVKLTNDMGFIWLGAPNQGYTYEITPEKYIASAPTTVYRRTWCMYSTVEYDGDLVTFLEKHANTQTAKIQVFPTVIEQCIEALRQVHKKFIVHSDIKLENFLYSEGSDGLIIVLSDFGLARESNRVAELIRTQEIAHPEQLCPADNGTVIYWGYQRFRRKADRIYGCQDPDEDFESLANALWDRFVGSLPWHNIRDEVIQERSRKDMYAHEPSPPPANSNPLARIQYEIRLLGWRARTHQMGTAPFPGSPLINTVPSSVPITVPTPIPEPVIHLEDILFKSEQPPLNNPPNPGIFHRVLNAVRPPASLTDFDGFVSAFPEQKLSSTIEDQEPVYTDPTQTERSTLPNTCIDLTKNRPEALDIAKPYSITIIKRPTNNALYGNQAICLTREQFLSQANDNRNNFVACSLDKTNQVAVDPSQRVVRFTFQFDKKQTIFVPLADVRWVLNEREPAVYQIRSSGVFLPQLTNVVKSSKPVCGKQGRELMSGAKNERVSRLRRIRIRQ
jgi:serine/threonine protein kinase